MRNGTLKIAIIMIIAGIAAIEYLIINLARYQTGISTQTSTAV